MLDIFSQLLDSVLPRPECVKNIEKETPQTILRFYSAQKFSGCVFLSNYKIKKIKSAVTANKFHNSNQASVLLSSLLTNWLKDQSENVLLIPVPLSKKRRRERGYNQVQNILNKLESEKVTTAKLLEKVRDTTPQTKLSRDERLRNLDKVFTYTPKAGVDLVKYKKIILLDDVVTTGATLKAGKQALTPHLPTGCKIVCLAIAH
ncbi:MAG: hypothetical protein R3B60_02330 [Candidatus Paceibacterota bacterium]